MGTWSVRSWPHHDLDRHRTSSWVQITIDLLHYNGDDEDKSQDGDEVVNDSGCNDDDEDYD